MYIDFEDLGRHERTIIELNTAAKSSCHDIAPRHVPPAMKWNLSSLEKGEITWNPDPRKLHAGSWTKIFGLHLCNRMKDVYAVHKPDRIVMHGFRSRKWAIFGTLGHNLLTAIAASWPSHGTGQEPRFPTDMWSC